MEVLSGFFKAKRLVLEELEKCKVVVSNLKEKIMERKDFPPEKY